MYIFISTSTSDIEKRLTTNICNSLGNRMKIT